MRWHGGVGVEVDVVLAAALDERVQLGASGRLFGLSALVGGQLVAECSRRRLSDWVTAEAEADSAVGGCLSGVMESRKRELGADNTGRVERYAVWKRRTPKDDDADAA